VPATGLMLDPSPWAGLPFIEGKTLHYEPAAQAATA
jgi:NADH-quinone oxidoreductase subunit G